MTKLYNYSLDTHALIWYFLKQKTLSLKAKGIMGKIFGGEAVGIVSTMVILEVYYVSLRLKKFDFSKFLNVLENSNIKIVPFGKKVLAKSLILPTGIDIHDRIIVATAILMDTPLITKDKVLRSIFPLETIW